METAQCIVMVPQIWQFLVGARSQKAKEWLRSSHKAGRYIDASSSVIERAWMPECWPDAS